MKTGNELIAEFMGGWNSNPDDTRHVGMNLPFRNDYWYDYRDMKFKSSWDWLMPVVEKIANMWEPFSTENEVNNVTQMYISSPIESVYIQVVDFIKWYNTTPPPQTESAAQQTSKPDEPSK